MFENYRTSDGKTAKRIKTSVYIWISFSCLGIGIYFIFNQIMLGAFFVLTAFPFFALYPLIRLLFGGKDSFGAAVVTAVVEETLKNEIKKTANRKSL